MKEIDVLNGRYVGLPSTPAEWTSSPEYKKIYRIKMSCGGGMGGSSWYEYVHRLSPLNTDNIEINKIFTVFRYDGKEVKINPNFIVSIEPYTLVTCRYHTENTKDRKIKFLIEDGKTVELINKFQTDAKRMNRKIRSG